MPHLAARSAAGADEGSGKVFCLVDARDAETATPVHREAHGLEADELTPVQEGI